jgi:hypothetical protein
MMASSGAHSGHMTTRNYPNRELRELNRRSERVRSTLTLIKGIPARDPAYKPTSRLMQAERGTSDQGPGA